MELHARKIEDCGETFHVIAEDERAALEMCLPMSSAETVEEYIKEYEPKVFRMPNDKMHTIKDEDDKSKKTLPFGKWIKQNGRGYLSGTVY